MSFDYAGFDEYKQFKVASALRKGHNDFLVEQSASVNLFFLPMSRKTCRIAPVLNAFFPTGNYEQAPGSLCGSSLFLDADFFL